MKHRLAALALCIGLAPAAAQQRPPRDVPYEFALAVLGNDPASTATHHAPEIYVGSLAPQLREIPSPRDGHVIGSVVWTSSSIAFFQAAGSPDSVRGSYAAALHAAGWQVPPPMPPPAYGGFRDAPPPPSTEAFCRDSLQLSVRYLPTDDGATRVRVQRLAARNGSPCRPVAPGAVFRGQRQPRYPLLTLPAGTFSASVDSCYRARENNGPGTGRMFRSTVPAESMLADYSRQLSDSGWVPGPSMTGEVVVQRFTRADSVGRQRSLTVSISSVPGQPTCRDAMMYLREPDGGSATGALQLRTP